MHILLILLLRRTLTQYASESDESFPFFLRPSPTLDFSLFHQETDATPHHFFQSLSVSLTGSPLSLLVQSSSSLPEAHLWFVFYNYLLAPSCRSFLLPLRLCSSLPRLLRVYTHACSRVYVRGCDLISQWATPREFRSCQTFHKGVSAL